ncbi:MAG: bifunctional oligoribonuclease/PAP phosphatase NrnA [bacterium]|nr:bifunctional oligoribonuclease/PAP phosphatase NrnA [bacterium]
MECEVLSLEQVCSFLKQRDNYTILTHSSPDGDTLGSGFAMQGVLEKLGKKARVICNDAIPQKFSYMIRKPVGEFDTQTLISVDVADLKLLGKNHVDFIGKIDLAIDHHGSNTMFAHRAYIEQDTSSCCEIIYKIAQCLNVELDCQIAAALYTGVATDTGCFKFSNTSDNTHLVAADLFKRGIDAAEINRVMFETKSRNMIQVEQIAYRSLEFSYDGRCAMVILPYELIKNCENSDLETVSNIARSIEGVLVGITLKEKEQNIIKISVRSHAPVDASAICGELGGGGHSRAAGCEFEGTISEAKQKILAVVKKYLEINNERTCTSKQA